MKPTAWIIVAVVALLTLPAACRHAPVPHYYVLDGPMDGPHRGNPVPAGDGLAIGVAPFRVDPPYDQDRLVYRLGKDAAEVRFYSYHRWAAPLSRMRIKTSSEALPAYTRIGEAPLATNSRHNQKWNSSCDCQVTGPLFSRNAILMPLILRGNTIFDLAHYTEDCHEESRRAV